MTVLVFLFIFVQFGLFFGSEIFAQSANGPQTNIDNETGERKSDFLLGKPKGFIGLHTGMFLPEADSDLFDMITSELTLEKNDFHAWDFGFDFGFDLREKVDLIFHYDYSKASADSEFREYVDEQGRPIRQNTELVESSITAGIKYSLKPPGRQLGEYAWLPSRIVPFVEGGVGALYYDFEQRGEFVDSTTLEIFYASLKSSSWAESIYLGGGVDLYLSGNAYLTLDLRYSWASHGLDEDFLGFDDIDLGGLRATAGIYWHF
jgi:hypothetical protein